MPILNEERKRLLSHFSDDNDAAVPGKDSGKRLKGAQGQVVPVPKKRTAGKGSAASADSSSARRKASSAASSSARREAASADSSSAHREAASADSSSAHREAASAASSSVQQVRRPRSKKALSGPWWKAKGGNETVRDEYLSWSDAEHKQKHGKNPTDDCPRCRFQKMSSVWLSSDGTRVCSREGIWPGTVKMMVQGRKQLVTWLGTRPAAWPAGKWGLGCHLCANMLHKTEEAQVQGKLTSRVRRFSTKWGRYEVNAMSSVQASALLLHSTQSKVHKLAMRCFMEPDTPPTQLLREDGDEALLSGSVPQVADWLVVWENLSGSFSHTGTQLSTSRFTRGMRRRHRDADSRVIKAMIEIMALSIRNRHRETLRQSRSISLSLDDKGRWRVMRYKCSVRVNDKIETRRGVLWVESLSADDGDLKDMEDDYGERVTQSIRNAIKQVCGEDTELFQHVVNRVNGVIADGAVQKALKLLRFALPNVGVIARDSCHVQRIATSDPLKRDSCTLPKWDFSGGMGQRWRVIMAAEGGLFPAVQASEKWRYELQLAQRVMKKWTGLSTVLKQVGHADARYESSASSSRHYVNLQAAIAAVLAMRVTDPRLDVGKRTQAGSWLDSMGAACAIEAGLTADWSAEALRYIRQDDCMDPDCALLLERLTVYQGRVTKLFIEGRILLEACQIFREPRTPRFPVVSTCVLQQFKAVETETSGGRL
ncbi:unnamed protein product [Symbiodinium natans]|uniref:Uncharacterized protein n=1 Tax=Symbiodinium natans TaxID=878477 RepID=A0A812QSR5_9DINO|nr:unnamed protein product [Symbiodinium natans]